jgi:hypothetical protein
MTLGIGVGNVLLDSHVGPFVNSVLTLDFSLLQVSADCYISAVPVGKYRACIT